MYKKPVLFFLLLTILFVSLSDRYQVKKFVPSTVKANTQNLQIKQRNPVVNEGSRITLTAIGSPDIAQVDSITGQVSRIKTGFATQRRWVR